MYLNSAYAPNITRFSNVRRRRKKLANVLVDLNIPAEFVSKQEEYVGLYNKDVVIVCDGGIDHDVPICPPPNKVSINFILFFSAVCNFAHIPQ